MRGVKIGAKRGGIKGSSMSIFEFKEPKKEEDLAGEDGEGKGGSYKTKDPMEEYEDNPPELKDWERIKAEMGAADIFEWELENKLF